MGGSELSHAGASGARWHQDQGAGEQQELLPGGNDSRTSGASATTCSGDGRSTERGEQSESQASPSTRTTPATRAARECVGRVAEVAGAQERKKSQEANASEHQRSASQGHASARWWISAQLQRADFYRCGAGPDCGSGGNPGAQRQRAVIASGGSPRTAAGEKAATDGGRYRPYPAGEYREDGGGGGRFSGATAV